MVRATLSLAALAALPQQVPALSEPTDVAAAQDWRVGDVLQRRQSRSAS